MEVPSFLAAWAPLFFGVHWKKVTIVGVGLLGGSLGLAIKERKLADRVEGYVRQTHSIADCERVGAVDHATREISRAVQDADLVVLCTPIGQMKEVAVRLLPALKKGCIVTDVGSVKGSVVEDLESMVQNAGAYFVGSHPMAGGEKTGVLSARANLFHGAACLVTPTPRSQMEAVVAVEEFWRDLGSKVLRMTPQLHDDLVSRSSHLPHVVAAELANYVLSPAHPKEQEIVCASGFRDTTRIASGSPEMWRDIVVANRKNLQRVLGVFIEDLQEFSLALEKNDVKAVEEFFENARNRRDKWCGNGNSMD